MSAAAVALSQSGLHLVEERPPGPGLTDFALWLRSRGCSEKTIEDRLRHLAHFARETPSFPNVHPMTVTAWIGRPGYAHWSRAAYFGHLRSYFAFAMEYDFLTVDPMARMRRPRVPHGCPRPLTPEEVTTVLAAAKPRMRAWLILGLYAGLRAHEAAKIRGEDIDRRSLFILGKGGVGDRIPTHPLIWAEAQNRPKADWWFPSRVEGGHVSSMTISTMTTRLFQSCGVEGSIHRCRHTYATELLRAGCNVRIVQQLMRHRSLDSTMRYTAVNEDEMLDGIARLGKVEDEGPEVTALRAGTGRSPRHPPPDRDSHRGPQGRHGSLPRHPGQGGSRCRGRGGCHGLTSTASSARPQGGVGRCHVRRWSGS